MYRQIKLFVRKNLHVPKLVSPIVVEPCIFFDVFVKHYPKHTNYVKREIQKNSDKHRFLWNTKTQRLEGILHSKRKNFVSLCLVSIQPERLCVFVFG